VIYVVGGSGGGIGGQRGRSGRTLEMDLKRTVFLGRRTGISCVKG
jgi:hypothetical protein